MSFSKFHSSFDKDTIMRNSKSFLLANFFLRVLSILCVQWSYHTIASYIISSNTPASYASDCFYGAHQTEWTASPSGPLWQRCNGLNSTRLMIGTQYPIVSLPSRSSTLPTLDQSRFPQSIGGTARGESVFDIHNSTKQTLKTDMPPQSIGSMPHVKKMTASSSVNNTQPARLPSTRSGSSKTTANAETTIWSSPQRSPSAVGYSSTLQDIKSRSSVEPASATLIKSRTALSHLTTFQSIGRTAVRISDSTISNSTQMVLRSTTDPTDPLLPTLLTTAVPRTNTDQSGHPLVGPMILGFVAFGIASNARITEPAVQKIVFDRAQSLSTELAALINKKGGSFPPPVGSCGPQADTQSILGFIKTALKSVLNAAECAAHLIQKFVELISPPGTAPPEIGPVLETLALIEPVGSALEEAEEQEERQSASAGQPRTASDHGLSLTVTSSIASRTTTSSAYFKSSASPTPFTSSTSSASFSSHTSIASQNLVLLHPNADAATARQVDQAISSIISAPASITSFLPANVPADSLWLISGLDANKISSIQAQPGVSTIIPNAQVTPGKQDSNLGLVASVPEDEPTGTAQGDVIRYTGSAYLGAPDLLPRRVRQHETTQDTRLRKRDDEVTYQRRPKVN